MNNPEFEKAAAEAKQKLSQMIDSYIEELDRETSSPNGFPTIDQIEKTWGNLNSETSRLYAEITGKAISQINERKLVRSKKENMRRKE